MRTLASVNKILKKILENSDLGEEISNDIEAIKTAIQDRDTILKNYGDLPDDEDLEEFEFVAREKETDSNDEYKTKYDALRKQYVERFFGGKPKEAEEIIEDQMGDLEKDEKPLSFDDLLEKTEGE